ncbi:hypothetical protein [Streptomyces sp. DT195]|uniref:hypothetical protein n=1 Tax=Streptomyces sp. DT195 TaxID=3393419 RepID=UPI003CF60940
MRPGFRRSRLNHIAENVASAIALSVGVFSHHDRVAVQRLPERIDLVGNASTWYSGGIKRFWPQVTVDQNAPNGNLAPRHVTQSFRGVDGREYTIEDGTLQVHVPLSDDAKCIVTDKDAANQAQVVVWKCNDSRQGAFSSFDRCVLVSRGGSPDWFGRRRGACRSPPWRAVEVDWRSNKGLVHRVPMKPAPSASAARRPCFRSHDHASGPARAKSSFVSSARSRSSATSA